jgi:D-threo-aldose 1-dehydrogenase
MTHKLGFGCASLFGLPGKRDRRAVLEAAYELGIRHFDVSPIYGLGLAEAELAAFVRRRSDISIATKFGIQPTAFGRIAGLAQPPIRHLLRRSPGLKTAVKRSGSKHSAGAVGRLLYTSHDYSVANASRTLANSRRVLRVDRIDYFLLHEPADTLQDDFSALVDYLEAERQRGGIRYWGPAGDLSEMNATLATVSAQAPALQMPYDLIAGYLGPQPEPGRQTLTFGFIREVLPRVTAVLEREPEFRQHCSELLDADLSEGRTVVRLLIRDALAHNENGTVLLSSTQPGNIEIACAAAEVALRNEAEVANMIREKWLRR